MIPSLNATILESGRIRARTLRANGLEFPLLEAGSGPLVLCLHGFPDHARSWVPLLDRLAREGYWAVAPTMRGYWPDGTALDGVYRDYATGGDVLAIIDALGCDRAMIIGHDLGARAAYAAASLDSERISKLVGMAVPYGRQLGAAFVVDGDQQRRSWYMFFFQTRLAETAIRLNDFAFIDRLWRDWSPGYVPHPMETEALKADFDQPGVVSATLGYYRQLFAATSADPAVQALESAASGLIASPALYLHGANDGCMSTALSEGMEAMFTGGFERIIVPGVGHFLHIEQPVVVGDHIVRFLGQRTSAQS